MIKIYNSKTVFIYLLYAMFCFAALLGDAIKLSNSRVLGLYLTLFRIAVPLFVFAAVAYSNKQNRSILPLDKININYLIFIFWILCGGVLLLISPYSGSAESVKELLNLSFAFLILYCTSILVDSERKLELFLAALKLCFSLIIFIALAEAFTGLHLPDRRQVSEYALSVKHVLSPVYWPENSSYLSSSIFYNQNDLSSFLAVFSSLFILHNHGRKVKTLTNYLLFTATILILELNDATICILAIMIGLSLGLIFIRRFRYRIGAALLIVLALQLFFTPWLVSKSAAIRSRIIASSRRSTEISEDYTAPLPLEIRSIESQNEVQTNTVLAAFQTQIVNSQKGTGSLRTRLMSYFDSLFASAESFFLGYGPGSYTKYFTLNPGRTQLVNPHNYWLEILFQYGAAVLVGYVVLYVYMNRSLIHILKSLNRKQQATCWGIIMSHTVMVISSIAPSSFVTYSYPWLLHGVLFASVIVFRKKTSSGTSI